MAHINHFRRLTPQLSRAKDDLSPLRLVEVRAGSYVLSTSSSGSENSSSDDTVTTADSMGSWQIALLAIACAVFFGALIAIVTICSLRYKRGQSKYPAPLAIPLGPGSNRNGNGLVAGAQLVQTGKCRNRDVVFGQKNGLNMHNNLVKYTNKFSKIRHICRFLEASGINVIFV